VTRDDAAAPALPPLEQPSDTPIAARIVTCLLDSAREVRVADVRIGLGYTAVRLADGRTGVAFTFRDQAQGCCSVWNGPRPLCARGAADLLRLLESEDAIEAGVGLACANALANQDPRDSLDGEVLAHLDLRPDDQVAMVGHFGPLVGPIRKRVRSLTILERIDRPSGVLRPQQEALEVLARCQVALITATSVINHTVDGLLEGARDCRDVALLGASTPLVAEAFSAHRVTMLSGVVVQEPGEVLRVVSEGGGMRQFSPHVRRVTVRVRLGSRNAAFHSGIGRRGEQVTDTDGMPFAPMDVDDDGVALR
jgi:uncharacterized protein (DUF4213/DUF364 family)